MISRELTARIAFGLTLVVQLTYFVHATAGLRAAEPASVGLHSAFAAALAALVVIGLAANRVLGQPRAADADERDAGILLESQRRAYVALLSGLLVLLLVVQLHAKDVSVVLLAHLALGAAVLGELTRFGSLAWDYHRSLAGLDGSQA